MSHLACAPYVHGLYGLDEYYSESWMVGIRSPISTDGYGNSRLVQETATHFILYKLGWHRIRNKSCGTLHPFYKLDQDKCGLKYTPLVSIWGIM